MFSNNFFIRSKKFLIKLILEGTENSLHQIIPFALFGILTNVPFYFFNQKFTHPVYENFWLRFIGFLLCFLLLLKNYWPSRFRKFLPLLWYITLVYMLPFFFLFMALKNDISSPWLLNMALLVLFLVLIVDWLSFILIVPLGFLFAYGAYVLTTHTFLLNPEQKSGILILAFYILIYLVFSGNNQRIEKAKLQIMRSLSATIAHELRTPLRTIHSSVEGIKDYLPALIDTYELAKSKKMNIPYINPIHYEALLTACDQIESEAKATFSVIEMLLMNVSQNHVNSSELKPCSINHCIDMAIQRYPFDAGESELVFWEAIDDDFSFLGNETLLTHVIFNLLKNALYYIRAARKGLITIWIEHGKSYNRLHFKDTAQGIPPEILSHIFDRFYSKTLHGAGVGLAFCKMVMKGFAGDIKCISEEGKFTEFVLYFPLINNNILDS